MAKGLAYIIGGLNLVNTYMYLCIS